MKIDLQKLSRLDDEVKILSNRKIALEAELETLKREIVTAERESDKKIARAEQESEIKAQERVVELDKREKAVKKAEKEIAVAEEEKKLLAQEEERIRKDRASLADEKKQLQAAKTNYLEKSRLAELRAQQLEATLKEQGKEVKPIAPAKIKEPIKKEKPEKKKRKKK